MYAACMEQTFETPRLAINRVYTRQGDAGETSLAGGQRVPYAAPELFLFEPNTLHSWTDVTVDTLMSACIVT